MSLRLSRASVSASTTIWGALPLLVICGVAGCGGGGGEQPDGAAGKGGTSATAGHGGSGGSGTAGKGGSTGGSAVGGGSGTGGSAGAGGSAGGSTGGSAVGGGSGTGGSAVGGGSGSGGGAGTGGTGGAPSGGTGGATGGSGGSDTVDAGSDAPAPAPQTTIPTAPLNFGMVACGTAGGNLHAYVHEHRGRDAALPGVNHAGRDVFAAGRDDSDGSVSADVAPGRERDADTSWPQRQSRQRRARGHRSRAAWSSRPTQSGAESNTIALSMIAAGGTCTLSCGTFTKC